MQRVLVISYRRFGTTCRSHLQGSRDQGVVGQIGCPETSVPYSWVNGSGDHGTDRLSRNAGPIFKGPGDHGTDRLSRNFGPIFKGQGTRGSWHRYVVPKRRTHINESRDQGVVGPIGCPETSVPYSWVKGPGGHGINRLSRNVRKKLPLPAAAACSGNFLPTLRYNLSVPSLEIKGPRAHGTNRLSRNLSKKPPVVVISYWRFDTICRSHRQGSRD
jgi:hypothetical protein